MVAEALLRIVDAAVPHLQTRSAVDAASRPSSGGWSHKEILGHLIDSAANNHQRFVRAQSEGRLTFPGYAQDDWVRNQHYQSAEWSELITFWQAFNHHLVHVIRAIPPGALTVECEIGSGDPVTLGFLIEDYLVHLRHHLTQLGVATI